MKFLIQLEKHSRFTAIIFIAIVLVTFSITQAAPPTSLYTPPATLNPSFAPGSAYCSVNPIATNVLVGSGTTGSVLFVDSSGNLNQDNANLFWDDTNNRLGIGTTSPLLKLDVAGSGRLKGTATSVLTGSIDPAASTTVTGVGTLFTTELIVGDRITVTGQTRTVTAIASNTSLTVNTAFSNNANDTSPDKLSAEFVVKDSSDNLDLIVSDNGRIGIGGTIAPDAEIDINGGGVWVRDGGLGALDASAGSGLKLSAVSGQGRIGAYDYVNDVYTDLILNATSINPASDGNIGIGTTSPLGRFHSYISGARTATNYSGYLENVSTNTTTDGIKKYGLYITSTGDFTGSTGASTNNYGIYIATTSGGDNNYDIYAQSGAYLDAAGNWTNASGKGLKENFITLDPNDILNKINLLSIYEWNYKTQDSSKRHIGPMAEDFFNQFHQIGKLHHS